MNPDLINQYSVYPLIALLGYVFGASNMALYIAKLKGIDLKAHGTGNPGVSNALITMGWKAAILVAIHDVGKAVLSVWLAGILFPGVEYAGVVSGVACVIGHMYPFYTHFRGGKGFAAYLGMTLALDWRFALILYAVLLVLLFVTNYIVVCTLTTVLAVPGYYAVMGQYITAAVLCVATVVILLKHRENLERFRRGEEIGFRSASRGDHLVKK